jgi:hypothetical protein
MGMQGKLQDLPIGDDTYKIVFTTAALCHLEELTDEAFWTFRDRMRSGGIRLRDTIALIAAGLEGARLRMFNRHPIWTLERTAGLFDGAEAPSLEDWVGQHGTMITRALLEALVGPKPDTPPASPPPPAKELDPSPLDGRDSGASTSTSASAPG